MHRWDVAPFLLCCAFDLRMRSLGRAAYNVLPRPWCWLGGCSRSECRHMKWHQVLGRLGASPGKLDNQLFVARTDSRDSTGSLYFFFFCPFQRRPGGSINRVEWDFASFPIRCGTKSNMLSLSLCFYKIPFKVFKTWTSFKILWTRSMV